MEPLNAVLAELAGWTAPTLMLVGNHDQVTLGGAVHSLTPLAAASPLIHVFTGPALYRGALWLPYRREAGELEAAVAAATAAPGLGAVFAHADVVSAWLCRSRVLELLGPRRRGLWKRPLRKGHARVARCSLRRPAALSAAQSLTCCPPSLPPSLPFSAPRWGR